jgi:hypothetical protein
MDYPSGHRVVLGDTLQLEGGAKGLVVGIIDEGAFAPPYVSTEWAYLGAGVLVDAEDAGLTHYEVPHAAWFLVSRG